MSSINFILTVFLISLISVINPVLAHCPLCSAATGAAVAVTRWYGIDDLIVGTFIGGFMISTAAWFNNILKKKKRKDYIPFQYGILILSSIVLTVLTFYLAGLLGNTNPSFRIFGIDKILVGMLFGSVVSLVAFKLHGILKSNNGNKSYLPFQVIIVTIALLSFTSLIYYLVGWL